MAKHKSDKIFEDIIGGFKVFLISVFVVYGSILIINSLPYISFKIPLNSGWFIALILGLLRTFIGYIKTKNEEYHSPDK